MALLLLEFIQEQPSPEIVWLTVAGTILSLIMAVPTVLDKVWERPHVTVLYEEVYSYNAKWLQCTLRNKPIRSRFLQILGIYRRPIEDLAIAIEVIDERTGQKIVGLVPILKMAPGIVNQRARLPASMLGIEFPIAHQLHGEHRVAVRKDNDVDEYIDLEVGTYYANLLIAYDGRIKHSRCRFTVTEDGFYLSHSTEKPGNW